MMRLVVVGLLVSSVAVAAGAGGKKVDVKIGKAAPRPDDVGSIDGMIRAYYEVVSGPPGPRDWARDATLYRPGTRFVALGTSPEGQLTVREMDHQGYVNWSDAILGKGFFEKETRREEWRWGNLAQVRSSYETRQTADGPVVNRGVNLLELMHDGKRWWITAAMWQDETKDLKLPPALAPAATP
jgi:hypothetical protein